ncbi:MAG: NADH-quinone oxidoreductase subunit N [Nitrococcus mobilis]|nr:NADH-quinone oxidoreductase subunit N [Nitrococcus mobilis]
MTATDFLALSPWLALTAAVLVVLLVVAIHRDHRTTTALAVIGLVASLLLVPLAAGSAPRTVTALFSIDGYALFFLVLVVLAALAVSVLAFGYCNGCEGRYEELYLLLLASTLGAAVLVASRHFASLLLGLELLSVALFALVAYPVHQKRPLEAGVKYFILAGVATAFLIFGMALVYAQLGALDFPAVAAQLTASALAGQPYLAAGVALIVAGLAFKLSLVPFHLWTPDVFEGAPAPITAFLATVSKGAVMVLLLRFLLGSGAHGSANTLTALALVGIVSMLVGNLLALMQRNLKRLLAYSSIAHMGYLLVPLTAGGEFAIETVAYYLAAYFIMTLGAFGAITIYSAPANAGELDDLEAYRGLFWQRPWLAGVFTAMLLALAGMPLTAGFVAKFYLFTAGADARLWALLGALIIGSALGLFYYLRVVVVMAGTPRQQEAPPKSILAGNVTLAALTILLLALGLYPAPLLDLIRHTSLGVLP